MARLWWPSTTVLGPVGSFDVRKTLPLLRLTPEAMSKGEAAAFLFCEPAAMLLRQQWRPIEFTTSLTHFASTHFANVRPVMLGISPARTVVALFSASGRDCSQDKINPLRFRYAKVFGLAISERITEAFDREKCAREFGL